MITTKRSSGSSSQRVFVHIWWQIQREPTSAGHVSLCVKRENNKNPAWCRLQTLSQQWIKSASKCLWFSALAPMKLNILITTSTTWSIFSTDTTATPWSQTLSFSHVQRRVAGHVLVIIALIQSPDEESLNCLLCFSTEATDFLQCPRSASLQYAWGTLSTASFFSGHISAAESSLINSPSGNGLLFFVILWENTKLVLTAPSLDVKTW